MMNTHAARQLLEKYKTGTLSEEESIQLESWYNAYAANSASMLPDESSDALLDEVWKNLPVHEQPRKIRPLIPMKRMAVAASILFALSVGVWKYGLKNPVAELTVMEPVQDIAPGRNKATLTLADGTKITLDDAKVGTLAEQGNSKISKTADGQILYDASSTPLKDAGSERNTVDVPRGGQYQVILPDGSKVWLNAASSLTYPASFAALPERRVELRGEAYFEVTKDKAHPFIVKSNLQEVEVLGTHFNVNAYQDEATTKTTLLEGSVRINGASVKKTLRPGEQSVWTGQEKELKVEPANVEEVVAWKNGYFRFNDEKIESIMRKLSRWYNIEVQYEGQISNEQFNGTLSRNNNISHVLNALSSTKKVRFKIEERRITVMQ